MKWGRVSLGQMWARAKLCHMYRWMMAGAEQEMEDMEGVDVRIPTEEMHRKEMEILGHTSASSLHSKANETIAS